MFSKCSLGVVPHVDVFVGRKVISTSYSSAILKVPLGTQSFNHWTTMEVLAVNFFIYSYSMA